MTIADRIQSLRKAKGVSQEELADRIGVSRQAVSKWESEQSTPDVEKIVLLSNYFEVTTDYILKGIEPVKTEEKQSGKQDGGDGAAICDITGTALNLLGVVISGLIWYSVQETAAVIAGIVFVILGVMVHEIGLLQFGKRQRLPAEYRFWRINVWLVAFIPLSVIYNMLMQGIPAPYPMMISNYMYIDFALFWIVYLMSGGMTTAILKSRKNGKESEAKQ